MIVGQGPNLSFAQPDLREERSGRNELNRGRRIRSLLGVAAKWLREEGSTQVPFDRTVMLHNGWDNNADFVMAAMHLMHRQTRVQIKKINPDQLTGRGFGARPKPSQGG